MMSKTRAAIYLDYSATTPVAHEVEAAMRPYWSSAFGNASSLHSFGRDAAAALDEAHAVVGCAIGARAGEIVFTGCGTEADNLALRGVAFAARRINGSSPGHIITTPVEHHAVEATAHQLHSLFGFDLTLLPVDGCGRVDPDDVRRAIRPDTVIVSVMLANNEVGTLQPVREIGAICREYGVPFHTDAVQAPAYLPVNVDELNVDLLALSAHKFYGPKGVGVLYLREGTPYVPMITGGGHERGRRPGTVNVAGAVGTAAAIKYSMRERDAQALRLAKLRDRLIEGVLASVPDARLSGHPTDRLPNHASFVFKNVDGESLLMALDVEGIAVSTGSACTSGNPEPSPVLLAMGVPREWALGSLRITLGYHTTEADIDAVLEALPKCVARVRAASLEFDER
ncbi:MAG: IscS subfamily cysteine desulfurase [Thermoflexales bacterium]|nr:IscS subfamily cysteine desulfurase [Thermoflexales bacterium]MDW8350410.1 IscS subfamily cysteine desulfurase [Anaerolineae bacterium]